MTNAEKRTELEKALKQAEAHAYSMLVSHLVAQSTVACLREQLAATPLDDGGADR